ncbi:MAG TPA: helix-turn-helix domain-containing protein, partial [Solirubrobacterales bacterium]|nr:helix-turn-helix domain-containing protein [Solirubrobacterales bacterium]
MSSQRTPYQEAARELLRQTVFDAARAELGSKPWSEITMADIASGAGVSRQTLYNEFGNRNEFGLA